jgi:hypothetical protein
MGIMDERRRTAQPSGPPGTDVAASPRRKPRQRSARSIAARVIAIVLWLLAACGIVFTVFLASLAGICDGGCSTPWGLVALCGVVIALVVALGLVHWRSK